MFPSKRYSLRGGGVAVDESDVRNDTTGVEGVTHEDDMVVDQPGEERSDASEDGDSKTYRFKYLEVVGVEVGSKAFHVHRNVLYERSAFFKAAMSAAWNADNRAIVLPEEESHTFDRYLNCLYHGVPATNGTEADDYHLIETYVLADKLGDPTSCNLIIDRIIEIVCTGPLPSVRCVNKVFDCLPERSPLRMLMIDCYVWEGDQTVLDVTDEEEWSSEFLYDVSREFLKMSIKNTSGVYAGVPGRQRFNICQYHQHSKSHRACPGARRVKWKDGRIVEWRSGQDAGAEVLQSRRVGRKKL